MLGTVKDDAFGLATCGGCFAVAEAYGYIALDEAVAKRLDRIAATIYRLGH